MLFFRKIKHNKCLSAINIIICFTFILANNAYLYASTPSDSYLRKPLDFNVLGKASDMKDRFFKAGSQMLSDTPFFYLASMNQALKEGRSFDQIIVTTVNDSMKEYLEGKFNALKGKGYPFPADKITVISRADNTNIYNHDGTVQAMQYLLNEIKENGLNEKGRYLIIHTAGSGSRNYPITAAARGNKGLMQVPGALNNEVVLNNVFQSIRQYHQVLDDTPEGTITVGSCDQLWAISKSVQGNNLPIEVFGNNRSVDGAIKELTDLGIIKGVKNGKIVSKLKDDEIESSLKDLFSSKTTIAEKAPALYEISTLGQIWTGDNNTIATMIEKPELWRDLKPILERGSTNINWWNHRYTLDSAGKAVNLYKTHIGDSLDFSIDVLQIIGKDLNQWLDIKKKKNETMEEASEKYAWIYSLGTQFLKDLGQPLGYLDGGKDSIFMDTGKNPELYRVYLELFNDTNEGKILRDLLGVTDENILASNVIAIASPEVEKSFKEGRIRITPKAKALFIGSSVREANIKSGGSIIVDSYINNLICEGDSIVWSIRGPPEEELLTVKPREVVSDVVKDGKLTRVRQSIDDDPKAENGLFDKLYSETIARGPSNIEAVYNEKLDKLSPLKIFDLDKKTINITILQNVLDEIAREASLEISSLLKKEIPVRIYIVGSLTYMPKKMLNVATVTDMDMLAQIGIEDEDWRRLDFSLSGHTVTLRDAKSEDFMMDSVIKNAFIAYLRNWLQEKIERHDNVSLSRIFEVFNYTSFDYLHIFVSKTLDPIENVYITLTSLEDRQRDRGITPEGVFTEREHYGEGDFLVVKRQDTEEGKSMILIKQILQFQFYLGSIEEYVHTLHKFIEVYRKGNIVQLADEMRPTYTEWRSFLREVINSRYQNIDTYDDLLRHVSQRITSLPNEYMAKEGLSDEIIIDGVDISAIWRDFIERGKIKSVTTTDDGRKVEYGLRLDEGGNIEFYGLDLNTGQPIEKAVEEKIVGNDIARLIEYRSLKPKAVKKEGVFTAHDPETCSMCSGPLSIEKRKKITSFILNGRTWELHYNISPSNKEGSFLLIPDIREASNKREQRLLQEDMLDLVSLSAKSSNSFIMYNSLKAGASQNHIHAQLFYHSGNVSVEKEQVERIVTEKDVNIGYLPDYDATTLIFEGEILDKLAEVAFKVIESYQKENIPVSVMFRNGKIYLSPRDIENHTILGVVPSSDMLHGGVLVCETKEGYESVTSETLPMMREKATLSKEETLKRVYMLFSEENVTSNSNSNIAKTNISKDIQFFGENIRLELAWEGDVKEIQRLARAASIDYKGEEATGYIGEDGFKEQGGYVFGKEENGGYVITRFIPFENITVAGDDYLEPSENDIAEALSSYAKNGIKLIGVYHNHSFARLASNQRPGPSGEDFNFFNFIKEKAVKIAGSENVAEELIGLVIEPEFDSHRFMDMARDNPEAALASYKVNVEELRIYPYLLKKGKPVVLDKVNFQNTIFRIKKASSANLAKGKDISHSRVNEDVRKAEKEWAWGKKDQIKLPEDKDYIDIRDKEAEFIENALGIIETSGYPELAELIRDELNIVLITTESSISFLLSFFDEDHLQVIHAGLQRKAIYIPKGLFNRLKIDKKPELLAAAIIHDAYEIREVVKAYEKAVREQDFIGTISDFRDENDEILKDLHLQAESIEKKIAGMEAGTNFTMLDREVNNLIEEYYRTAGYTEPESEITELINSMFRDNKELFEKYLAEALGEKEIDIFRIIDINKAGEGVLKKVYRIAFSTNLGYRVFGIRFIKDEGIDSEKIAKKEVDAFNHLHSLDPRIAIQVRKYFHIGRTKEKMPKEYIEKLRDVTGFTFGEFLQGFTLDKVAKEKKIYVYRKNVELLVKTWMLTWDSKKGFRGKGFTIKDMKPENFVYTYRMDGVFFIDLDQGFSCRFNQFMNILLRYLGDLQPYRKVAKTGLDFVDTDKRKPSIKNRDYIREILLKGFLDAAGEEDTRKFFEHFLETFDPKSIEYLIISVALEELDKMNKGILKEQLPSKSLMKSVKIDDLIRSENLFSSSEKKTFSKISTGVEHKIEEEDTSNLGSGNSYDAGSHEDLREYLKAAKETQVYGEKIEGIEFSEEYAAILRDLVEGLSEGLKIILVEHNRGSPLSAERRMLFYDEKPMRWIFSHAGTRKDTGKFIYLPKTAFLELSKTESGKIFLKKLILEEMRHIAQKLSGDWAEDYHRYEDNELRQFVIDYLGDRLYPIEIRTPIHKLDSINNAIGKLGSTIKDIDFVLSKIRALKPGEKKTFDSNDPRVLEIVSLLNNLESSLKRSKRAEKRRALEIISYIKKDLASGNIHNTLNKLGSGKGGARALLNSYLKVLFEKKNRFENELSREKVFRLTAEGEFDAYKPHDKETEAILAQEFDRWSNSEESKTVELYDKVVKFYEIWYSRGERGPPELALISKLIKDEKIMELIKKIRRGSKDFDNLLAYKRQEEAGAVIKKEKMNVRDQRLLRAVTFTPKFYWAAEVPVSARKYISMLLSSGMFGAGILYARGVLNVDYTGDGSEDDWFMKLSAEKLSENRYDRSPGPGALFTSLSNFSGETKKYFRELWKAGKKGHLYEMYNSYQQTSILRDYIWDRDKQVYLIKWKDVSGIEERGKWVLVKDIVRNRPVAFIHSPDERLIEPLEDLLKAQGSARTNI